MEVDNKTVQKDSRGSIMLTAFGCNCHPLDLSIDEVDLSTIALSLSKQCRFNGHIRPDIWHYSVAQHSVIVSQNVPKEHAVWGLLHDASETYIGDIIRPLKNELNLRSNGFISEIETKVLKVIAKKFNLPWPMPKSVHDADTIVLATEIRDVMKPPKDYVFPNLPDALPTTIRPAAAQWAHELFLQRAYELGLI